MVRKQEDREVADNTTTITNAALAVDIARIGERLESVSNDLHRIEATLDGFLNGANGRPGVIERLALSEQAIVGLSVRMVAIETSGKESAKLPMKVIMALIGIITTLAGIGATVASHFLGSGGTPPGH